MAMRLALKVAILAQGISQRQVAAQCGIHENRFSKFVCGWTDPREDERQAIAAALGRSVDELFAVEHAAELPQLAQRNT